MSSTTAVQPEQGLRQRKKDATYQAIGDAAWALFAEKGYTETSINDIAERANIAPRTFFRYYPTKEAVMYPEFEQSLARVREAFFERPSDEPVMTSLISAMETLTHSMTEDTKRNQARLDMMKRANDDSIGDYFRRTLTEQIEEMVHTRDAALPDVELRARLASGIIGLIMDTSREHWLENGASEPLPDVGQHCMSLVLELLGQPRD
jgi:AcrR family transcriptional regulator